MSGIFEWQLDRRRPTFSFYLTAHKCRTRPGTVHEAARLADALTIAGTDGPTVARHLRAEGLDIPIRFDGVGYAKSDQPDARQWLRLQRDAGAAECLMPGFFIAWSKGDHTTLAQAIREQSRIASDLDATMLLAVDARWLSKGIEALLANLLEAQLPIALVLAHPADPLSEPEAVAGLRRICSRVPDLSLHRADHGAVGALAFGVRHASMGLTTSTRHYVPPHRRASKRPGNVARLFDRLRLDWFLASDIAAWDSARGEFACQLECCDGRSLARFLDANEDSDLHNMSALGDFADIIIHADPADRRPFFLRFCADAVSRYGLAGFHGPENPKAQLTAWAFS